ncbi:hypothetical protein JCM3765_002231 [Sporobolomyces pararoseus]
MLYVASAQAATAQLGAVKCDFYGTETLVINKFTRLELHTIEEDGSLELVEEIPIWSGISTIASGNQHSSIVVLTTCLRLFVLSFQPHSAPKVQTVSSISIAEPFGRVSEYQTIQVDPHGRCLVIHVYDGLVRIIPLESNPSPSSSKPTRRGSSTSKKAVDGSLSTPKFDLDNSFNVRVSNLNVTSLAVLTTKLDSAPAFSLVFTDHTGAKTLTTYNIDLEEKDIEEGPVATEILQDPGSEICLGIPDQAGVLVVGEQSVTFFDEEGVAEDTKGKRKAAQGKKVVKCILPLARITSYAFVSRERLLLGDIFGKLFLVDIVFRSGTIESLKAADLGDTTSPTSIVPVTSSLVYLTSRFGDAQLVKMSSEFVPGDSTSMQDDENAEEELQLVASYPNLAPIVDSCVVGGEGGSAGYVVTCSGAYKTGSLRVIRRGVGFSEEATIDMEGVQRMWSLDNGTGSQYLVLGFFDETRILQVSRLTDGGDDDFDVEETELSPFKGDVVTLLASRLDTLFVQVTKAAVEIGPLDGSAGTATRWVPEAKNKITSAAAAGSQLLVGLQGGEIILLAEKSGILSQQSSASFEHEIASIDLHVTPQGTSLAAVGLWTSQNVHLLSVPDLVVCATQALSTTYLIRSVLLTTFSDGATIFFAGLGDGSLVTMDVDTDKKEISSTSLKTVVLGNRPFLLSAFHQNGKGTNVFACSDRPTVISRNKERLVYSSVNIEEVAAVASIPGSDQSTLAIVSPGVLRLGRINAIQQIDVRTIPLDEDEPRRIAHDPKQRTFGVLCSRRDVDRSSGLRSTVASVRFIAEETLSNRSTVEFGSNEEGQAITRFESGDSTFFAIGTAITEEGAAEPEKGRLVLYGQSETQEFIQIAEISINGCPFAIVDAGNSSLALAVNSQVLVYSFDLSNNSLSLSATWSGAFIALSVARGPDSTIVVADALRSMTLLKFTASPQPKLEEVARDYRSRYMVGVESILSPSEDAENQTREFIGAETDLNLFTVQYDPSSAAGRLEDAGNLAPRGGFHLGEMVSRFRHGVFGQQYGDSSGAAQPKLIFTTSAGSIGIIAELDSSASTLLSSLERNMRSFVKGVGDLSQEEFRSFKIEKRSIPSSGFVDGTFVQQFLDLPAAEQDQIMEGRSEFARLQAEKNEVIRVLEEVGRLH